MYLMSNAAAPVAFYVVRRCDAGDCEPGCNCHLPIVAVDVDELTDLESAHVQAHGTPAQRAELAAYLAPSVASVRPASLTLAA